MGMYPGERMGLEVEVEVEVEAVGCIEGGKGRDGV